MTVAQFALDMYVDMMVAGSAAAESVVAGSASTSGGVRWCQYVGGLGGAAHCPGSPPVIMSCLLVKHSQHAIMIKEPAICMLHFVADSEPEVSRRPSSTYNPDLDEVLDVLKSSKVAESVAPPSLVLHLEFADRIQPQIGAAAHAASDTIKFRKVST